ncbi:MAG: hypothetical protein JST30_04485 [Armatimonadetes bacterium]|nr:hypothetical protein [Armatimonadota bacterium]
MHKRLTFVSLAVAGGVLAFAVSKAQDSGIQAVIGNVFLQSDTPGTAQVGHANIKGTFRAGQVFVQQASGPTIPVVGNNTAIADDTVGGSFSSAGRRGTGVRGTATNNIAPGGIGVYGESRSPSGRGVQGTASNGIGVVGSGIQGVFGTTNSQYGVAGQCFGTGTAGVFGEAKNFGGIGVLARWNGNNGFAGLFQGRTQVEGDFRIFGNPISARHVTMGDTGLAIIAEDQGALVQVSNLFGLDSTGYIAVVNRTNSAKIESTYSGDLRPVFQLRDRNGAVQAAVFTDGSEKGTVQADVKNFVQPDPDDLEKDIVYASVEGPEAAAYVRGTARLVDGAAEVALPKHFQNVALTDGMTVQLTPMSADSEGLAVVVQGIGGFKVRELRHGKGSYSFAWEVKAVRRGFADYKVSRPWDEHLAAESDRAKTFAARLKSAERKYGIVPKRKGP